MIVSLELSNTNLKQIKLVSKLFLKITPIMGGTILTTNTLQVSHIQNLLKIIAPQRPKALVFVLWSMWSLGSLYKYKFGWNNKHQDQSEPGRELQLVRVGYQLSVWASQTINVLSSIPIKPQHHHHDFTIILTCIWQR